jgi:hypothetical protein
LEITGMLRQKSGGTFPRFAACGRIRFVVVSAVSSLTNLVNAKQ